MIIKVELTPAQARDLFFSLKDKFRVTDTGPLARAEETLISELEVQLAREQKK